MAVNRFARPNPKAREERAALRATAETLSAADLAVGDTAYLTDRVGAPPVAVLGVRHVPGTVYVETVGRTYALRPTEPVEVAAA